MKKHQRPLQRVIIGLLGLLAFLGLLVREANRLPDGAFHVHFLDVGQGDAALLVSPSGKQIVIDGGPDLSALSRIGERMSFFDRTIDLLVLTHPNTDHLVALPELAERYRIGAALLSVVEYPLPLYERFLTLMHQVDIPVIIADPKQDIVMGDGLILDVVWPPGNTHGTTVKNTNDASVVVRALYGNHAILFTGDIEKKAEMAILRSGTDVRSNVLKAAHHGSKTSSSTGFLLGVKADIAIISVGKENSFGHPNAGVLERLRTLGMNVHRTDVEGTVSIESRGS
jgi:competence protein ComEC